MFFGQGKAKPRGLFGALPDGETNMLPQTQQPGWASQIAHPEVLQQSMQQKMQGQPREGINWLGVLGDAAQGAMGQSGAYADSMAKRREKQDAMQAAEAERQQKMGDWVYQKQWERDNPAPVNNDTVNDYNFYKGLDEQGRALYDQQHRGDPIVNMTLPNGQFYSGPSSQLGPALGQHPGGGNPDSIPTIEDGHQYTPGPGGRANQANWRTVGGGAGNSARPFPTVTGNRLDNITMQSESGGNPNAVSSAGARGLMQVMPSTARAPGFGIKPSDGSQADDARVGREYRRVMQARYGNNLPKMWAAYNWGPGNLDRALAQHGEDWLNYAPAETRAYINNNMRQVRGR